ncbi:hypothetical protein GO308_12690 [Sphingomonas sp. SFZ2018-12]|uniref:hypothetical protein n=1 Tax=Sphingomonas sp. SFZ2018-12 TaxID=2683197 RepID=UPI001F109BA0|nr:hypothetical protein [Sphingomonas sp. SFZ2018-12]MCH4893972.1 hypothetical protein [Sphingomonas sp. SFZ2018-12]
MTDVQQGPAALAAKVHAAAAHEAAKRAAFAEARKQLAEAEDAHDAARARFDESLKATYGMPDFIPSPRLSPRQHRLVGGMPSETAWRVFLALLWGSLLAGLVALIVAAGLIL